MTELLSVDRAKYITDIFPEKRILVVGDIILDEFIWGSVFRISPEAPVPVVEAKRRSFMTGGAANVARNLRDLGVNVDVVGVVGEDHIGEKMIGLLKEKGIGIEGVLKVHDRQTTLKTRVIGQHQQIVRIDWEDTASIVDEYTSKIIEYIIDNKKNIDAIIFEDYGKGIISQNLVTKILAETEKNGIITSFDPKMGHYINLDGITVATPNQAEAFDAYGEPLSFDPDKLDKLGWGLLKKWGANAVLITLGEHGMALFENGKESYKISTVAKEVYDVSGAGDTVIASLTASLAAGATLRESAIFSNYAAGVVVGKVGTASVTPVEIIEALTHN